MSKRIVTDMIQRAKQGEPLFLPDVRAAFLNTRHTKITCLLQPAAGNTRRYLLPLPEAEGEEEQAFVASYLYASVYNLLSVLGGVTMTLKIAADDALAHALCKTLEEVFQVHLPRAQRSGYGKCLNVADRVNAALHREPFSFEIVETVETASAAGPLAGVFESNRTNGASPALTALQAAVTRAQTGAFCGIDVGGTDIKLVVVQDGRLKGIKEYDWDPARFTRVEELTEPILLLARVMQRLLSLPETPEGEALKHRLLEQDASLEALRQALIEAEAAYGAPALFCGIGVSFPDVVIQDQIVGGETTKTAGIRAHARDYEEEFSRLTAIKQQLLCLCRPNGAVHITNDGNMAAYTAAVELMGSPDSSRAACGVFAHTLGTELGTGWMDETGTIPPIPLEVYSCIIDLGSWHARTFLPQDVRSIANVNTGLFGTFQRYCSQSGAFRLAQQYFAAEAPDVLNALLREGYLQEDADGGLRVVTAPKDMRKPLLERLMALAEAGQPQAERIFREIGRYMAAAWQETEWLLHPKAKSRVLFGRFLKRERCFQLMQEGAASPAVWEAGNESMAYTSIMEQLAQDPRGTVAQFGQAVGAVYFAARREEYRQI